MSVLLLGGVLGEADLGQGGSEDLPPFLGRCIESAEPSEIVGLEPSGQHPTVGDRARVSVGVAHRYSSQMTASWVMANPVGISNPVSRMMPRSTSSSTMPLFSLQVLAQNVCSSPRTRPARATPTTRAGSPVSAALALDARPPTAGP